MQVKLFLTVLATGALTLVDNSLQAQTKKHIKIIEIVDGDTTITEKTTDNDKDEVSGSGRSGNAYSYAYSSGNESKKKTQKKKNKSETYSICIDMDDNADSFKKVILKSDENEKNVYLLDVETSSDAPYEIEVKDASKKTVFIKKYKGAKNLKETLDLKKNARGTYTIDIRQGGKSIGNHTITIE
jgi:hypothetical protein